MRLTLSGRVYRQRCFLAAALSLVLAALPARAQLQLQVSQPGGPTLLITDQFAPDFNPTVGTLQFLGSTNVFGIVFGDFTLFGDFVATSNRIPGDPTQAQITGSSGPGQTLFTLRNNTATPKTFTLAIGDTGFLFPSSRPLSLTSIASGTFSVVPSTGATSVAGSLITAQTFGDAGNSPFGTGFPAQDFMFAAPGGPLASFSNVSTVSGFNPPGPYSLTIRYSITLAGNTQLTGLGGSLTAQAATAPPVPEPGAVATVAVIAGMTGLGLLRCWLRREV